MIKTLIYLLGLFIVGLILRLIYTRYKKLSNNYSADTNSNNINKLSPEPSPQKISNKRKKKYPKSVRIRVGNKYITVYSKETFDDAIPKVQSPKKEDLRWVEQTDEFKNILSRINNSNDNFFITGKAGTGKSTLLKCLYNTTNKICVLLAPTGRAAINISGQTIHSFFHLDWGVLQGTDYDDKFIVGIKNIDIMIIDEISMVRADTLDSIDHIMKNSMNNDLPFGGKQVIFFGDPYQLPPIVEKNKDIIKYFSEYYTSPYFFDSEIYSSSDILTFELEKVFRQQDENFIQVLNRIRNGSYSNEDLSFINSRVATYELQENKVLLTPYKDKSAYINNKELNLLDSPKKIFKATIKDTFKKSHYPAPEIVILKKGAKVMFVKNNRPFWVNGSLGDVEDFTNNKVIVKTGGVSHTVEIETWEDYKYKYNSQTRKLEKRVVGTFTQIPLILAWAITINKGQGATLPGVHIDMDRGAFDYGQTYVALSRTKKLTDITLEKPITKSDIKVDERVNEFYNSIGTIKTNSKTESQWKIGLGVEHSIFGKGRIIKVTGYDPNIRLTVLFSESTKTLIAKFAKLKIIDY